MSAWRKKPVEVEAVRWSGSNWHEVYAFAGHEVFTANQGDKVVLRIKTLEGEMTAMPGDWVIKGTRGEFYPCKPGPFADTFEVAGETLGPEELKSALADACDVAVWLTGAADLTDAPAWPEMREKLHLAMEVAGHGIVESDGEPVGFTVEPLT